MLFPGCMKTSSSDVNFAHHNKSQPTTKFHLLMNPSNSKKRAQAALHFLYFDSRREALDWDIDWSTRRAAKQRKLYDNISSIRLPRQTSKKKNEEGNKLQRCWPYLQWSQSISKQPKMSKKAFDRMKNVPLNAPNVSILWFKAEISSIWANKRRTNWRRWPQLMVVIYIQKVWAHI